MNYYDLQKNWRKVKRHVDHPEVQAVLVRDFNLYTRGRWKESFKPGMVPSQFESCDWRDNLDHRGRPPAFWDYVKHSACHWLVNFSLTLAQRVEPKHQWRIIFSDDHSTVWDGDGLLFDFNFSAMGIPPKQCFKTAYEKELKPGKLMKVYLAQDYK